MALPAPNLDDRRFQELVDDAKRLVQQKCPDWTDHNVSDPGVTLIETFAWMADILLYRLNRVPDRHYVKFLELLGVELFPPVAARTDVTFWLSAPQAAVVRIPAGVEVATPRTETDDPVGFTVFEELAIVPCAAQHLLSHPAGAEPVGRDSTLRGRDPFHCFAATPQPGDALYVGLTDAVPRCAVNLRVTCDIEGIGVDPTNPPLRWEAHSGSEWVACVVDSDTTGGLNRAGDVVLHVPADHATSVVGGLRAGWLRAVVLPSVPDQAAYSASPRIGALRAFTVGGTAPVIDAEPVLGEVVGTSSGVPGQRFRVERTPVLASTGLVLEVSEGDRWEPWSQVQTFADAGPGDRLFHLDHVAGEVVLGPAVRQPEGSVRQYGAVPPKGAVLRLRHYFCGGGHRGNVAAGTITVLRSSIPFIQRVGNRRPAMGGVDGEDLDNARLRGPLQLRSRNRAVTAEDYELLTREAAPELARVRALPATDPADPAVRVLVVPAVPSDGEGRVRFEALVPTTTTLAAVAAYLDLRRVIGARVVVEPPRYQGITIVARVRCRHGADPQVVHERSVAALYGYFHPLSGGPDGAGWPFGRPVHVGEVYAVLQRLDGVELIEDARLFAADPITAERGQAVQRIEMDPGSLVFSFEHQVLVEAS